MNLADGFDTRAADVHTPHCDVGTWPGLISPRNRARLLGGARSEAGQVVSRLHDTQQMAGSIPALRTSTWWNS
jgi:hypothetical protein